MNLVMDIYIHSWHVCTSTKNGSSTCVMMDIAPYTRPYWSCHWGGHGCTVTISWRAGAQPPAGANVNALNKRPKLEVNAHSVLTSYACCGLLIVLEKVQFANLGGNFARPCSSLLPYLWYDVCWVNLRSISAADKLTAPVPLTYITGYLSHKLAHQYCM